MKNGIIAVIALMSLTASLNAQNINWQAFNGGQNQIAYVQAGWDYGLGAGLGYGFKFDTRLPVLANIEYSFPAGERLFDDFKIRLGGQVEVLHSGSFSATIKAYCPFRRYENRLVRMESFGSEFSGVFGFYRSRWFVAGEFGFDKAIATHIHHTGYSREIYPDAVDGWYVPTGGNYFYGLQGGLSFGGSDITLKAGRLNTQNWNTTPFVPFYAQVGYTRRF